MKDRDKDEDEDATDAGPGDEKIFERRSRATARLVFRW